MIGPSYARHTQFWKLLLFSSVLQGIVLRLIALSYFLGFNMDWHKQHGGMSPYEKAMKYNPYLSSTEEQGEGEEDDESNIVVDQFGLGNGSDHGGKFPIHPSGLVHELKVLKSENIPIAIPFMACSILSIGGGAVVGPEAALGTMGTSIGSIIGRRWRINIGSSKIQAKEYVVVPPITGGGDDFDDDGNNNKNDDDDRSKENENESNNSNPSSTTTTKQTWLLPDLTTNVQSCCFDGMSVAFGQLFPAQYLSPILLIELAVNYHIFTKLNFMETVTSSGFASSI